MDESPLGAAALAGTGFDIDPFATAHELGFNRVTRNSIDAVSDRDYMLEVEAAASICGIHMSRLGAAHPPRAAHLCSLFRRAGRSAGPRKPLIG